jgi:hypothetical protein
LKVDISLRGDKLYIAVRSPHRYFEIFNYGQVMSEQDVLKIYDLLSLPALVLESLKIKKAS